MTSRPSTAAPILAVLAIVLAMLGAYVVAYFTLGSYHEVMGTATSPTERYARRVYAGRWLSVLFAAGTWIESRARGLDVEAVAEGDSIFR